MISILFSRGGGALADFEGKLVGFKVSGHAGYADAGEDVVCAAVSSAVQLICNLITENFDIPAKVSVEKDNTIVFNGSDLSFEQIRIVATFLDGFKTHLEYISEEYPECISIKYSEV